MVTFAYIYKASFSLFFESCAQCSPVLLCVWIFRLKQKDEANGLVEGSYTMAIQIENFIYHRLTVVI